MSLMVDYISMPPKSQEVSNIQSAEHTKFEHGEQNAALGVQQQVQQQHETTIRRNKAQNDELRNEERRGKQNRKRKKGNSERKKNDESENKDGMSVMGGGFDMRV